MQVWVREALWHDGEIFKKRGWDWMREVQIENYMTLMAAVTSHLVRAEGHVWWRVFAVIKAVALCNDVLSNIYWVCAYTYFADVHALCFKHKVQLKMHLQEFTDVHNMQHQFLNVWRCFVSRESCTVVTLVAMVCQWLLWQLGVTFLWLRNLFVSVSQSPVCI